MKQSSQSFAVFTLHAHPRLYANAVITGWGEAACLWYEDVLIRCFFLSLQTLLKDWIMSQPASHFMRNSSPCNSLRLCPISNSTSTQGRHTGCTMRAVCSFTIVFWGRCSPFFCPLDPLSAVVSGSCFTPHPSQGELFSRPACSFIRSGDKLDFRPINPLLK